MRLRPGFEATVGVAAGLLTAGLIGVTVADVVGRYALGAPLPGAFELTELMVAALVFSALPLTTEAGEHVSVELIDPALGDRGRALLDLLVGLVSAGALGVLAWRLGATAARLPADGGTTVTLLLPLAPLGWFAAACSALSAVAAALRGLWLFAAAEAERA